MISDTPDTQKSPLLWSISQHPHSEKVKKLWGGGRNPRPGTPKTYSAVSHNVMSALPLPALLSRARSLVTGQHGGEVSTCRK